MKKTTLFGMFLSAGLMMTALAGSDAEFFALLDLTRSGLESVRSAVEGGDYAAARANFASYLRNRSHPNWDFDWHAFSTSQVSGYDTTDADQYAANTFTAEGVTHTFSDPIDWDYNPTDNIEFTFDLNRHQFWDELTKAY